jgi:hypothetical protein
LGTSLRHVPAWAWLTAIVLTSAAFRALLARDIVAPFVLVDEVIWSELARGIAETGEPLLRGEPNSGYSVVYPLLLAPVYAAFDSLPDAYAAVKALNSALMSLAAVPAYFLARRVVGVGLSLLAALLAIAVPSLVYTGTVMTENVFYPLFLVAALLLVLVLERPTGLRVALLAAIVALAYATRVQAAALVPAVLLAPLLLALFEGRGLRETLVRQRILYASFAALGVVGLVLFVAAGRTPSDLLGAYSPVGEARYEIVDVLRYLVWHAAELTLYVLVIPVAVLIVLVGRARSLDPPLRAFLAATVALVVCTVSAVAAFASVFSERIEERNMFYVAPLLLVLLLAWVERGAPRPATLSAFAGAVAALVVILVPFDRFLATSAITDTLMLLPFWSLQDSIGADWIAAAAFALSAGLGVVFVFVPRRWVLALPLLVLGLWAVSLKPIWSGKHGFEPFSRGVLFQGIRFAQRDWIDRALPDGAAAGFLWTGRTDRMTVNQNEFFSRAVGPVYYLNEPTPGGLPESQVFVNPMTGAVTLGDGRPVTDDYLVADETFEPVGERLASDLGWGVTLWRTEQPVVSATRIDGLYPNDTWSGETVTYLRRRCVPGRLVVELAGDGSLFLEGQAIVARVRGEQVSRVQLPSGGQVAMAIPLAPLPGEDECRVVFTVTPTEVPAEVTGGESDDERVLGAHFNRFRFTPAS